MMSQEKLFHGLEVQGKGRQDEFINPEGAGTDDVLTLVNIQGEMAAPLSLWQEEIAGNRAEFIGLQNLPLQLIALCIAQLDFQGRIWDNGDRMDHVTLVKDSLELEGVARIVSAPVQIEIDELVLRQLGNTAPVPADGDFFASAHPAALVQFGLQIIVRPVIRQELGHRGRKSREPLGRNAFRCHDFVSFAEDQPAGIHRLACDVIRHIESKTARIQPMGQGKRMAAPGSASRRFAVHGLDGIIVIIRFGKR